MKFSLRHSFGPSSVSSRWCIQPSPSSGHDATSSTQDWSASTPVSSSVRKNPCAAKSLRRSTGNRVVEATG